MKCYVTKNGLTRLIERVSHLTLDPVNWVKDSVDIGHMTTSAPKWIDFSASNKPGTGYIIARAGGERVAIIGMLHGDTFHVFTVVPESLGPEEKQPERKSHFNKGRLKVPRDHRRF